LNSQALPVQDQATPFGASRLIHILLVIAVIAILLRLISGRRV
jgi:hypothetical protein